MIPKDVTKKVCLDFILLCILPLPALILKLAGSPIKRGFFCDDEDLRHPYKNDTIPLLLAAFLGLSIPIMAIIGTELVHYLRNPLRHSKDRTFKIFKRNVHPLLVTYYVTVGAFLFGAAVSQVSTEMTKYAGGRLRPHFLTVCMPNYSKFKCKDANGYMAYIEDDVCTGDAHAIKEARLSHPSGHASFTAYCFVYLAIYLQYRLTWRKSQVVRPMLQVACLYFVLYVCLSRVSDYKHFWIDVVAGAILGTVIAFVVALVIYPLHKQTSFKHLEDVQLNSFPPGQDYGTTAMPESPSSSPPMVVSVSQRL